MAFKFGMPLSHRSIMLTLIAPAIIFKIWTGLRIKKLKIASTKNSGRLIRSTVYLGLLQILLTAILLFTN